MNSPTYLKNNSNQFGDREALSIKNENGNWETDTWSDVHNSVIEISKSLIACGIESQDKVSIYSYNQKKWYLCYHASQYINAIAVGVYHTCSSNEVEWIVGNSDSKIIFLGNNPNDNDENEKMPNHRLLAVLENLDKVNFVVTLPGVEKLSHEKIISWDEFMAMGKDITVSDVEKRFNQIKPEDTSSLIYTSGTTGNPKGVIITHDNWDFECQQLLTVAHFSPGDRSISWLPGAHVFGQAVDCHFTARLAMHSYIVDSPLNTVDYSKEIQPHLFISVPRIYEKVYSNLKSAVDSKAILKYGLKVPGLSGILKNKLKTAAGFANVTYAISGAAPINPDILTFFQKLGIPLFEGYGLTESSAGATLNYGLHNKIGSVGKKFPDTNIKINDDGEILLQGRHIMNGYYNNKKATEEALIDGWFYTGDVGRIDNDGFLFITGRKKEIYVSSAGKNIPPLVIEETMKSIPIISQCFLVGDNRNYCSALFTLDVGVILRDKIGIEATIIPKDPIKQIQVLSENGFSLKDYTDSEAIFNEVQDEVNKLNLKFSNPEQLKKFSILPRDFTIDDGELTPTLKIRRKQITENWTEVIDSMYQ